MTLKTITRASQYFALAKDSIKLRCSRKEEVQQVARRHLVQRLGRMRGLPQKLGQMISFSLDQADGSTENELNEFATLQEKAEPLPLDVVLPVLESEWNRPADEVLSEISPWANAASLGQVHRARLQNGREVAVKVQYPGIHDAVMTDLKMLGWLSLPVGNLRRGFDLKSYQEQLLCGLEQELDYLAEAQSQMQCRESADPASVVVPCVVHELTTGRVLVSDWEDGDHWRDVPEQWPERARKQLGNNLLRCFHDQLFRAGQIHADWHPGNLRFRRHGDQVQVVMYDFGCVCRPTPEARLALLRLIRATRDKSEAPLPLFLKLGFDSEHLTPLAEKLPALCRILLEPYVAGYPYNVNDWRLGERVSDILGNDRWNFRIAGPANLILLLRAFFGLKYYLCGLDASLSWSRVLQPILAEYQVEMDRLELPARNTPGADFSTLAQFLRIQVSEHGQVKVRISHNASAIDHLGDLIDTDLKHRIEEKSGTTLDEMVSQVRRRGYRPGVVFQHTEKTKEIRVWLD